MNAPIPVNTPLFNGNEKKYLNECINTGWISSEGPFIQKLEDQFGKYINRKFGIAVSSGTAALDIAVKAVGLLPGDEVILPTFTIISPVFSLIKLGIQPVYVDSNRETWNMDINQIEAKITSKTRAILIVHIYGLPADMHPLLQLAKKHNLLIIEDAAQMHGQTYAGEACGSFGDISIFSFYANKNITTGEGGMILCDDKKLMDKCKSLRNLAFEPDKPRFVHYESGWNYRMTNMQAAVGLAQLEQLDDFVEIKKKIGFFYQHELDFLKNYGYQLPLSKTAYADNIYWVFGLVAPDEMEKNRLISSLQNQDIGTRPFFWCMHEQPVFKEYNFSTGQYPVAENMSRCGFYIPSGLGITEEQLAKVAKTIKNFYGQA